MPRGSEAVGRRDSVFSKRLKHLKLAHSLYCTANFAFTRTTKITVIILHNKRVAVSISLTVGATGCMNKSSLDFLWSSELIDGLTAYGDWQASGWWQDLLVKVAWPFWSWHFKGIIPLGTCLPRQNYDKSYNPSLHGRSKSGVTSDQNPRMRQVTLNQNISDDHLIVAFTSCSTLNNGVINRWCL